LVAERWDVFAKRELVLIFPVSCVKIWKAVAFLPTLMGGFAMKVPKALHFIQSYQTYCQKFDVESCGSEKKVNRCRAQGRL